MTGVGTALALFAVAPAAGAQNSRAAHTVVVASPTPEPGGDSVRTILQRDFNFGNRVLPLNSDPNLLGSALSAGGSPNYSLFAKMKARSLVIPRVEATGVIVSYHDIATRRLVKEAFFPLHSIPALRPALLRDSVLRAHEAKDQHTQSALARTAFLKDSLSVAAQGKPDRDKTGQALIKAKRDSLMATTIAEEARLIEQRKTDFAERDAAIPALIARDSVTRDSLTYVRRMAVHSISDELTRWLTGQRGYAQSRVVYVHNGMLRVVDSDGANDRKLTGSGLALSPQWHPSGNRVVFSHFTQSGTQIAQVDVWNGRVTMVKATQRGLNLTPAYSTDGRKIVYASGGIGPTDLVVTDADAEVPARKLSFSTSETSSPTFSPDGGRVAYISPKAWQGSGPNARYTPQIYTMNADGTGQVQLTPTAPGVRTYRTSPDWSPDGTTVAYMQQHGDFQLWTIGVRDRKMKKLTTVGENEDPTWSPDSRHIAFTSNRSGAKEIWVMDVQTGRSRQLTRMGGGARLAAWSRVHELPGFAARSISAPSVAVQEH